MPRSQEEHYNYTLNEWTKSPFTNMLEIIFNDTSVKSFIDIGANVGGVTSALVKLNYIQKLNTYRIIIYDVIDKWNTYNDEVKKSINTEIEHSLRTYLQQKTMNLYGIG